MIILYSHNIWNCKTAGFRNKLTRSLISDANADVCTFQECGPMSCRKDNPDIVSLMSDIYEEASLELADSNYTPVFYKKDRFDIIDKGYLAYDGLNDLNSKSVNWAVIEDKQTKKRYAFASTHFWWMARGEIDADQRVENAKQLKEVCDKIVEKHNIPVIIGGDFNNGKNSVQGDKAYTEMIKMGFRDVRYMAEEKTKEEFTCREANPVLKDDGTFEKCEVWPHMCIDYIFVYGDFEVNVRKFHIETNDTALTASDHCPLIAWLDI